MRFEEKVAALKKLLGNFALYCAQCMRVLPKEGGRPQPFLLNRAQMHVHAALQKQKEETGKVRALILKGRQQGISTLIAARFYQITSTNEGKYAFIVTHEQKATDNLFKMVKRYHDHNPLAPSTGATNAKELVFDLLDSGYKLATAGSKDVGRSNTTQIAHLSEFAFWDNPSDHLAGLGNTVGNNADTEIIIESTANGIGNAFHQLWQKAERGEGEYIAIFVPWMWSEEYTEKVPDDFQLSEEEAEYQKNYGCTLGQMVWRRNKIATYEEGKEWLFDQEYPAVAALAFKSPTANPLINPGLVNAAMASKFRDLGRTLVIGCDPAEYGDDRTAIVFRRGRVVIRTEYHEKLGPMAVAGKLAAYYKEFSPDAIFVDKIGVGSGVVDRLIELQVPVIGVNSAMRAHDPEMFINKRAEMWWDMLAWFQDYPCRLPPDAALASDLSAPGFKYDSSGRRQLESKDDMRKRKIRSPDGADALALTFAEPVVPREDVEDYHGTNSSSSAPTSAGY